MLIFRENILLPGQGFEPEFPARKTGNPFSNPSPGKIYSLTINDVLAALLLQSLYNIFRGMKLHQNLQLYFLSH